MHHDAINEENDGNILPGIGTGIRFTVDKETSINIGMDIAAGKGDWTGAFIFGLVKPFR